MVREGTAVVIISYTITMCHSQTHRVAGVVIELLHDAVVRVSLDCSVAFITYQQVHIIDLQIRK